MSTQSPQFIFFGTPHMAVIVLDELKKKGLIPSLIVTAPDKPQGRKLIPTPPPVKVWADEHHIETLQPETLKNNDELFQRLASKQADLFVVAAYGKIIPRTLLDIPPHGTLNVHPSILPLFRGPSPIQYQILEGVPEVGVSIMLLDEKVDHGPILNQEALPMPDPLPTYTQLEDTLAHRGGVLLAETIPAWIAGDIEPQEQDHAEATFTAMITKQDGQLDLGGDDLLNYHKIKAFTPWPGAYFFTQKGEKSIRVRVTVARLEDGRLVITRVIPEGKKEMDYQDFLRGNQQKD